MQMKAFYSLTPKVTADSLLGRRIYRIKCCDEYMRQVDLKSDLPHEERPFGVSHITLHCTVCKRKVELDTFNSNIREYDALGYMRRDK